MVYINPAIPPELTPPVVYLKGEFALWRYKIPYLSVVVPLKFAAEKFSLLVDIPEAERMEWSLEELFQRDIDWRRIDEELVKYLQNENQPQFFNALAIALLPKSGHGFGARYETKSEYPPLQDQELESPTQIG